MAYRGRPILSLRMPREYIEGLHKLAAEQHTTASDLVRDLVKQLLDEHHIDVSAEKPLDGQISV